MVLKVGPTGVLGNPEYILGKIFLRVLRISQFVQRRLGLRDDQVWNNIQKFGNTTAASIPIALCEAYEAGAIKPGDLVCLAAFGSGFTWGAALLRW